MIKSHLLYRLSYKRIFTESILISRNRKCKFTFLYDFTRKIENQMQKQATAFVYMVSLGCPKNLVDSEVIAGNFITKGIGLCSSPEGADVYLINTCAFIKSARDEAESWISKAVRWKKKNPEGKTIICGCLNQSDSAIAMREKYPEIDLWLGINDIEEVHKYILGKTDSPAAAETKHDTPAYLYNHMSSRLQLTPSHYAYIKIADGCDNRCSYCSIPGIRGALRSRDMDSILREARGLVGNGCRELILIAQDSSAYGFDLNGSLRNISSLIGKLDEMEGDFSVRLMYTHPAHFTDELVDSYKNSKRLLHYVDMPIQHISDKILKDMGRKTDSARIKDLIRKLRTAVPDICVRTSLIVGFPGEGEGDFNELIDFVRDTCFDRLGVFSYSHERSTPASKLTAAVPGPVAEKRKDAIMRLQAGISLSKNKALVNMTIETSIDSISGKSAIGRTYMDAPDIDNQVIVSLPKGRLLLPGDKVKVKIHSASEYEISGKMIVH